MFPKRSNIVMANQCDIQTKITRVNDTGQRVAIWSTDTSNQRCGLAPAGSAASIRVAPTTEEADYITLFFPHTAKVDYQSRIVNIRSKGGELIYDGPFEIRQIDKPLSMSGKVTYLNVIAKSVVE